MRISTGISTTVGLSSLLFFLATVLATSLQNAAADEKVKATALIKAIPVTGEVPDELSVFTDLMVNLVAEHDIPGASLAIAKGDTVLFSQGFGYADRAAQRPIFPTTRFRIASLSKPITAVAILHLVQRGKFNLDDHLVDVLDLPPLIDGRFAQVTVRHLLQHQGGWDRSVSYDPMFRSVEMAQSLGSAAPATARDVILYMTGEKLDHAPGTHYAYSNFGYNLLGRIIEHQAGMKYSEFVQREILHPLGISNMQIGATRSTAFHETKYYSQNRGPSVFADNLGEQVPSPYGAWHLEAMDSHGAWIASAVDLVKFSAALEDAPGRLLDADQLIEMAALDASRPDNLPDQSWHYGLGWVIRPQGDSYKRSHTGSLAGTSTLMARRADGIHWVVLFNQRDTAKNQRLSATIEPLLKAAADALWSKGNESQP
jgi:N-acyl-D-amino-acid deacylase